MASGTVSPRKHGSTMTLTTNNGHKRNLSLDSRKDALEDDKKKEKSSVFIMNRTNKFHEVRKSYREKGDQEMNDILCKLAKLSTSKEVKLNRENSAATTCTGCGDAFEWSWMRFSSVKNICNLCQRYFCNNCACASINVNFSSPSHSPSPSPSPSESSGTKDVLACNHCAEVLQSYYRRLAFQKERRVAELNPIVNYYRDTKNMKAQVMLLLDRYTDIISALSCIDAGRYSEDTFALSTIVTAIPNSTAILPTASRATVAATVNATVSVTESVYNSSKYFLGKIMPVGGSWQQSSPALTITTPSIPNPPLSRSQSVKAAPSSLASSSTVSAPSSTASSLNPSTLSTAQNGVTPLLKSKSTISTSTPGLTRESLSLQLVNENPQALYAELERIEKEIAKSLVTYNRCIKELSEITKESDRESEIIRHVKNASIDDIQEIALTLKTLRKRLVQIDLRLLEKLYVTLKAISLELPTYSFSGVFIEPIERCLEALEEETKGRLENIAEKWEPCFQDLTTRVEEMSEDNLLALPSSANTKAQAARLLPIVNQLSNMAEHSIASPYVPSAVEALKTLTVEVQQYIGKS